MSKTIDTGGPAFPRNEWQTEGMTLRDYFAAKALQGLSRSYAEGTVDDYLPPFVANDCYKLADAMIAERNKP